MYDIYHERHPESDASEQLLAGQVRAVLKRKVFSDLELEEFRRQLEPSSSLASDLPNSPLLQIEPQAHTPSPRDTIESSPHSPPIVTSPDQFWSDVEIQRDDRPIFNKLSEYFRILTEENNSERPMLPPLRSVRRNKFMCIVNCVNNLCQFINTSNLTATANLMYAAAKVVTEAIGLSCQRCSSKSGHPWKLRLQNKLTTLRKDLSRLVAMQSGHLKSQCTIDALFNKYLASSGSTLTVAIKTLRQRITATSRKIARYTARTEGFYQNRLFGADQHKFYASLSSSAENDNDILPNDKDVVEFWSTLWGDSTPHNESTCWIYRTSGHRSTRHAISGVCSHIC